MYASDLIAALRTLPPSATVFFDTGLDDDPVFSIGRVEYNDSPTKADDLGDAVSEGIFLS